jgi:hypothetical protein
LDGSIARPIFDTRWRLAGLETPQFMNCNRIPNSASEKCDPLRPCYAQLPKKTSRISLRIKASECVPRLSSCLKLHHSTSQVSTLLALCYFPTSSPLRPLLVKHTMTALLTTNRISPLQGNFGVTVTAQVIDGRAFDRDTRLERVATRSRDCGGDLICFARHACRFEG